MYAHALMIAMAALQASAVPTQTVLTGLRKTCTNPLVRREWRDIPVEKRKKYIEATKCMQAKAPIFKKTFPIVESRYDDFVAVHVNVSAAGRNPAGGAGHDHRNLLPWHRYFITLFEDALVKECGWDEGIPYWNWYLDIPDGGGFGGNGVAEPKPSCGKGAKCSGVELLGGLFGRFGRSPACVQDGPFKNLKLRIGPKGAMKTGNPVRCLTRTINSAIVSQYGGTRKLQKWLNSTTFEEFMNHVQKDFAHLDFSKIIGQDARTAADIHFIGHSILGGEMVDPLNSVNEPLFWLHHGAIDYFWSIWQEADRKNRIYDLDTSPKGGGNQKALAAKVEMGMYGADTSTKEIADPENRDGTGKLCFKYEGLPVSKYQSQ